MPASQSEVLVGRRYLERGFLDKAMKLFVRNAALVEPADWALLADRLMERDRVLDAAIRLYEMAGADRERWARVVDVLTAMPDRELLAIGIAERHLAEPEVEAVAPPRRIQVVK